MWMFVCVWTIWKDVKLLPDDVNFPTNLLSVLLTFVVSSSSRSSRGVQHLWHTALNEAIAIGGKRG